MGAYSEIDVDRRYGDSPFEEGDTPAQNIPAFVEEPLTAPPAVTAEENQTEPGATLAPPAQEADTALTETPNDTGKPAEDAESTATEDEKRKAHDAAEAKRKAEFDARQAARKLLNRNSLTVWPP